MMRRSLGVLVVLLAMAACGREGPLLGTAVVSPPQETETPLPTVALSPSPTAEATESPEATTATPEETATAEPDAGNAGIFGSVVAGPTCPVEQSSSPCPERPVPDAEVTAKEGDRVAGTARADSNGKFTMRLEPGTYQVTASSPSVMSCETEEVTVGEHQYQPVRINCDTGVR